MSELQTAVAGPALEIRVTTTGHILSTNKSYQTLFFFRTSSCKNFIIHSSLNPTPARQMTRI